MAGDTHGTGNARLNAKRAAAAKRAKTTRARPRSSAGFDVVGRLTEDEVCEVTQEPLPATPDELERLFDED